MKKTKIKLVPTEKDSNFRRGTYGSWPNFKADDKKKTEPQYYMRISQQMSFTQKNVSQPKIQCPAVQYFGLQ